jgi:hypothetical protein
LPLRTYRGIPASFAGRRVRTCHRRLDFRTDPAI